MLPPHVGRRHLAVAAAGCAALAAVAVVDPSEQRLAPPCPLRATTGLDCPLCGATRATHALLRGDLWRALDLNALYVVALPVALGLGLWWLRKGDLPGVVRRPPVTWAALLVAIAFMVLRNVPSLAVLGA